MSAARLERQDLSPHLSCEVWQYGLWSFQAGSTKLERFLQKNQHIRRKLLNFGFWINGDLSKTGHHFINKVIQRLILYK